MGRRNVFQLNDGFGSLSFFLLFDLLSAGNFSTLQIRQINKTNVGESTVTGASLFFLVFFLLGIVPLRHISIQLFHRVPAVFRLCFFLWGLLLILHAGEHLVIIVQGIEHIRITHHGGHIHMRHGIHGLVHTFITDCYIAG